ncbi:MAG: NapC/NirT family cytochrome c [Gallionella sp.]
MSDPVAAGKLKKLCQFFCRPSTRFSLLTLLGGGFIAGIIFLGGFNTVMHATNTEAFCIGCHEMRGNYEEYKKTIHYSNRTGVRATCPDCHVPKEFIPKMLRKFEARHDVWARFTGKVDTPEKFEANRKAMAEREWARMKASDSSTCRSCHTYGGMNSEMQDPAAVKKHTAAAQAGSGKTCIDCHQGIAHELPKDM